MKTILGYWNRKWQSVSFDTDTGKGCVRWLSLREPEDFGWAYKYKRKWYAVWPSENHLIFQVGTEKRPMTDEYQCDNRIIDNMRELIISPKNEGLPELEIVYRDMYIWYDPTFDDIDKENEDFFLWLCRLWNNESRRMGSGEKQEK